MVLLPVQSTAFRGEAQGETSGPVSPIWDWPNSKPGPSARLRMKPRPGAGIEAPLDRLPFSGAKGRRAILPYQVVPPAQGENNRPDPQGFSNLIFHRLPFKTGTMAVRKTTAEILAGGEPIQGAPVNVDLSVSSDFYQSSRRPGTCESG